jgi:hypothetical protein
MIPTEPICREITVNDWIFRTTVLPIFSPNVLKNVENTNTNSLGPLRNYSIPVSVLVKLQSLRRNVWSAHILILIKSIKQYGEHVRKLIYTLE